MNKTKPRKVKLTEQDDTTLEGQNLDENWSFASWSVLLLSLKKKNLLRYNAHEKTVHLNEFL